MFPLVCDHNGVRMPWPRNAIPCVIPGGALGASSRLKLLTGESESDYLLISRRNGLCAHAIAQRRKLWLWLVKIPASGSLTSRTLPLHHELKDS